MKKQDKKPIKETVVFDMIVDRISETVGTIFRYEFNKVQRELAALTTEVRTLNNCFDKIGQAVAEIQGHVKSLVAAKEAAAQIPENPWVDKFRLAIEEQLDTSAKGKKNMGAPGCDDAPLIDIPLPKSGVAKHVTLIYPYYDNRNFLLKQFGWWSEWPRSVADNVSMILVDDCSPTDRAIDVIDEHMIREGDSTTPFPIRIFRIDKDVRWNWLAARNIGAHYANDGWLLLTDMDHVVSAQAMERLIYGRHDPEIIYRFARMEHTGVMIHPHPNSWFMTREMFWKVGGYDERMSGYYGSDSYYRRRCAATAPIRIMSNVILSRHEHIGDSSTVRYLRKQPEDARLRPLVRSFPPGSRPLTLSFPYHEE